MAVDDSKVTLKAITKAVAKNIGTGKFKTVAREDALLNKEISVTRFNIFFIHTNTHTHTHTLNTLNTLKTFLCKSISFNHRHYHQSTPIKKYT